MDGYNQNILAGSLTSTFLFFDFNIKFNLFYANNNDLEKSLPFSVRFPTCGGKLHISNNRD